AAELRAAAAAQTSAAGAALARSSRRRWSMAAIAVVAAALGFAGWRHARLSWARSQIPVIETLAKEGRTFEAYDSAVRVRRILPDNGPLIQLWPDISNTISVTSRPAGAQVYLRR